MVIRWSVTASNDLEAIHEFIARDSAYYAAQVCADIVDAVDGLAGFPERGRVVPEVPHAGFREVIVGSYRVVYRLGEEAVEVVTVFHGARLLRLEAGGA